MTRICSWQVLWYSPKNHYLGSIFVYHHIYTLKVPQSCSSVKLSHTVCTTRFRGCKALWNYSVQADWFVRLDKLSFSDTGSWEYVFSLVFQLFSRKSCWYITMGCLFLIIIFLYTPHFPVRLLSSFSFDQRRSICVLYGVLRLISGHRFTLVLLEAIDMS